MYVKRKKGILLSALAVIIIFIAITHYLYWYNFSFQEQLTEEKYELYLELNGFSMADVKSYELIKPYFFSGYTVVVKYLNDENSYEYHYSFYKDEEINEITCIPKNCTIRKENDFYFSPEEIGDLNFPTKYKSYGRRSNYIN